MEDLIVKVKHLLSGYIFKVQGSGLLKSEKDVRDFDTQILGFGEYTPKNTRQIIPTLSIKNQGSKNNCQWQATTVQKEVDEGVILSCRSLSAYGQSNGLLTGNGYSALNAGDKALISWGIAEEQSVGGEDINDWGAYTALNLGVLTPLADDHKSKSYWNPSSRNDRLKCLDDGRVIKTAIDWYTGYNQGGGFSSPYIIDKILGWKIGGHCVVIIGYDLNYNGRKVYIMQNSYGADWCDGGKFYIDMDFLDNNSWGFSVQLDIPLSDAKKLNLKSMLQNMLRDSKGGLWFIKGNQKQRITSLEGVLTLISVEFGVTTDDKKVASLQETNKFFPV